MNTKPLFKFANESFFYRCQQCIDQNDNNFEYICGKTKSYTFYM